MTGKFIKRSLTWILCMTMILVNAFSMNIHVFAAETDQIDMYENQSIDNLDGVDSSFVDDNASDDGDSQTENDENSRETASKESKEESEIGESEKEEIENEIEKTENEAEDLDDVEYESQIEEGVAEKEVEKRILSNMSETEVTSAPISEGNSEKDIVFSGGDGTENDPYQITYAEQLDAIRNDLSACYKLINDIDMSEAESWVPIGTREEYFTGSFDGNSHSISNLLKLPILKMGFAP